MYLAPQAGHAPHHVPKEWADRYKGGFDRVRGHPAGILARQIGWAMLPEGTQLSTDQPHGEPTRPGRTASRGRDGHGAALGFAERR